MRRLIRCAKQAVHARNIAESCSRCVSQLSRSRPLALGFALLVTLIAIPGGELFAQRGFVIPVFQDYTANLTGSVGVPVGAVPTATIPFSLNDASLNGRILGADPLLSASLGMTSGGLASGYYYDLLTDQIALRRLLPQGPSGLAGNPALRDYYINPVSPFVSGWIPGPGDSALEDRLARTQRGELLDPQTSSNLSSEGTVNPNQNLFSRRIAQSIVLPAPAATEQNSEADLELETVPDTDEKVTAVFPPAPRGLAARGVNTRFADSLEPFSALRFAMRGWSSMPFTLLRPGELGWSDSEIAGDDRGVPPEFAVPAAIESGAMVAEASVAVPASRQPMPQDTVAAEASSSATAASPSSAAPANVGDTVATVAETVASVPSISHVADDSRQSAAASRLPSSPASPPLFDQADFHSLASSEDALALALAGGRAEPTTKVVAATQSATTPAAPSRPTAATVRAERAAREAVATRVASAAPGASAASAAREIVAAPDASVDRVTVSSQAASMRSTTTSASGERVASASPKASTGQRSRYDFEGSTAAIDRLLVANSQVISPRPQQQPVVSTPAPAATPVRAPATVAARTQKPSSSAIQPSFKPRPNAAAAAVVAARSQPARGASTANATATSNTRSNSASNYSSNYSSNDTAAAARQAGAGQVGAGYVNSTHGRPIYGAVTYYDGYGRVIDGGVYGGVYDGVTYGSYSYGVAADRRSPQGSRGEYTVANAAPRSSQPSSLTTYPAGSRPVKTFAQWRQEQLTEANRLIAAGERARLSGKPNTAWRYFQQAEQIRDIVAGLP
jgi:hypothetical protein